MHVGTVALVLNLPVRRVDLYFQRRTHRLDVVNGDGAVGRRYVKPPRDFRLLQGDGAIARLNVERAARIAYLNRSVVRVSFDVPLQPMNVDRTVRAVEIGAHLARD